MNRMLPGLAMACLVTGCAEPGAPPPSASSPPEIAGIDEAISYTTVSLRVPGMH
ncbi:MAG: hypothetical protein GY758_00370 [Fuerstiella sp.]|jgi:hypothetical protein|nr:hypothetical protein [Fuerstiella sp.]MCP4505621.1 hypothetical protein [Fuerstiella sp.]MDG2131800.1 hypothetical protein [Fuerstiella sp.]